MLIHDRKTYEEFRDTVLYFISLLPWVSDEKE